MTQKPITVHPLPFTVEKYIRKAYYGDPDATSYLAWGYPNPLIDAALVPLRDSIYRQAYGRLMAEVSSARSQLGADFAERKQAINAITSHAGTLLKAARYLRKGYVLDFFKTLGIRKRTWRTASSDMGGVWLEYSYGWKPLVEDMHAAANVLQSPFIDKVVRGRAQGKLHAFTTYHDQYSTTYTTHDWVLRLQLQMKVSVSNWIAWRANELGLTNPLAIAWEVVPFSFVVDWFLPIGNYLQSLTDFVGLNQEDPFTTWYSVLDRDYVRSWYYIPGWTFGRKDRRVNVKRELVLPSPPKLQSRFTGFYSARGANAIALLTSTLKDLPSVSTRKRPSKANWNMHNWDNHSY
jgi:hypothetical protein